MQGMLLCLDIRQRLIFIVLKCTPKANDKLSTPLEASFRAKLYKGSRDCTRILQTTAIKMEYAWDNYRKNI
jgi:hypothetical protein